MADKQHISPGSDGYFLTNTMFKDMLVQWKDAQTGKRTITQAAIAFGISAQTLSYILKGGAIGTNARKKISKAWFQIVQHDGWTTSDEQKQPVGGGRPIKKIDLKMQNVNAMSPQRFKEMIMKAIGVNVNEDGVEDFIGSIESVFGIAKNGILEILDKDTFHTLAPVTETANHNWNLYVSLNFSKHLKKRYFANEITPEIFAGMVRKLFPKTRLFDLDHMTEARAGFGISWDALVVYTNTFHLDKETKTQIAEKWNNTGGSIPDIYNETMALHKLNDHAGGSKLSKADYDIIEQWAKNVLKQKKYRQSIFRGIRMLHHEDEIIKIMDNKSIKLSTFEGAGNFAESWSTDPSVAMYFAANAGAHRMFSVLESRPNPKDIVIYMERQLLKHVENHKDHAAFDSIIHFTKGKKEKEVVVRTGNRKYTLCRNIVFLNIPKKHLVHEQYGGESNTHHKTHKINVLFPIVKRIGDEKNLARFQKDLLLNKESYQFACGSGNFVYLASERASQTWMRKLASR